MVLVACRPSILHAAFTARRRPATPLHQALGLRRTCRWMRRTVAAYVPRPLGPLAIPRLAHSAPSVVAVSPAPLAPSALSHVTPLRCPPGHFAEARPPEARSDLRPVPTYGPFRLTARSHLRPVPTYGPFPLTARSHLRPVPIYSPPCRASAAGGRRACSFE
jgi:hypothetical protein